jgi:hypothetical protein
MGTRNQGGTQQEGSVRQKVRCDDIGSRLYPDTPPVVLIDREAVNDGS